MLLLLALLPAHALPPNREVRLWEIGNLTAGAVERMAISDDGGILVGRTRMGSAGWLVDIDRWALVDIPVVCEVNGVAPIPLADGTWEAWVGCANGEVRGFGWDGRNLFEVYEGDKPLVLEVDTKMSGIWYDPGSQLLYAVSLTGTADQGRVHVIDPFAGTFDGNAGYPSYPKDMPADGFVEGVIDDGYLIVSHGAQDMTSLQLGVDTATVLPNQGSTSFHCQDMAPAAFTTAGVYCIDELGSVAEFRPLTSSFIVLPLGVLSEPQAVSASLDLTDGWIAVTGNEVKVWEMDTSGGIPTATPYFQGPPDADNPIQDMVNDDGYLYGGGEGGGLHIVTARPWVYPGSVVVAPESAVSGDTVVVTFQVDTDSDWQVRLGGDRTGTGGTRLADGATAANTDVVVELVVDDAYVEGDNKLYIIATDGQTGLTGHAVGGLFVDDPPAAPQLTDANVEFADGALTLSFEGVKDEDLDHYEIWVAEKPFEAADWPLGGPAWDGSTPLVTPIQVAAVGGERVTKRITPLENDVTYYIGVHAWDAGGKEGLMSRVVEGRPREVFSASELAGDEGGAPCSTGPRPGGWLGLVGVGALALARRRRRTGSALLAATVAALLLVAPAARAEEEDHWWEQDTTPTRANFEIRYGNVTLVDPLLEQVYSLKPHDIVYLEVGPQFFHLLELDVGFGFMQDLAFAQDADGIASGERTMMTWWPFTLDGTLRGHFVDEQPVVPFLRYGWDYVLWSEKKDVGFNEKDTTQGAKFGTHYALGANVLLDVFQPGRASFLETQTGINDSWITVEWRRQRVDAREAPWGGRTEANNALDFSGDVFTIGLKLDW